MRSYYYDNLPGNQREPHDADPSRPVDPEALRKIGIYHRFIPPEEHEAGLDAIASERKYKNRDTVNISRAGLGEMFDEKLGIFFQEHMHEDEEIRYILSGDGYFDVRESPSDAWIRLLVEPGDLIVLPAGIYHRFTTSLSDNIIAVRLFKDEPKWTPYNRGSETDSNVVRLQYLNQIGVGA